MKMRTKIGLVMAVLLGAIYLGGSWFFSGIVIDFRKRTPDEDRTNLKLSGPRHFGFSAPETVRIRSGGLQLSGWFFKNPSGAQDCGVILHHGRTGTRYGGLKYGQLFWPRGCHLLSIDARKHGKSEGRFSTYGYHEKSDMLAWLQWFEKKTGLSPGRIGFAGESMGAAIALQTAALKPDIAFVLADSSYSSLMRILEEQGRRQYGFVVSLFLPAAEGLANLRAHADLGDVAPVKYAKRIRVPVILVHSAADKFTHPDHSRRIFKALTLAPRELYITQHGAAHGRSIDVNLKEYKQRVDAFLKKNVPGF